MPRILAQLVIDQSNFERHRRFFRVAVARPLMVRTPARGKPQPGAVDSREDIS